MLFSSFGINYNSLPERFRKVRAPAVSFNSSCLLPCVVALMPHNSQFWASRMLYERDRARGNSHDAAQGSVIIRQQQASNKLCSDGTAASDELFSDGTAAQRAAAALPVMHVDIIKDDFWHTHPDVLA